MVETLNIKGRGIDVLVDLLNSQAESVFPKPLCIDFTSNLGLPLQKPFCIMLKIC